MDSSDLSRSIGGARRAYFRAAEAISKLSDHHYKIGCVVVANHRIISSGHNGGSNTHGFQKRLDDQFFKDEKSRGCKHAEVDALLPLIGKKLDLSRATVYVFRRNCRGELAMARPCPRCMSVIKSLGIRKINYSTPDGFAEEAIQ